MTRPLSSEAKGDSGIDYARYRIILEIIKIHFIQRDAHVCEVEVHEVLWQVFYDEAKIIEIHTGKKYYESSEGDTDRINCQHIVKDKLTSNYSLVP